MCVNVTVFSFLCARVYSRENIKSAVYLGASNAYWNTIYIYVIVPYIQEVVMHIGTLYTYM